MGYAIKVLANVYQNKLWSAVLAAMQWIAKMFPKAHVLQLIQNTLLTKTNNAHQWGVKIHGDVLHPKYLVCFVKRVIHFIVY